MGSTDSLSLQLILGIAHALFMNRLHLLRLTEVVRLGIKPDQEDGTLQVPPKLDLELKQQALNYVLTCLPEDMAEAIHQAKDDWLRPA